MKKELTLSLTLLFLFGTTIAQISQSNCEKICDNISIYGDTNDNVPTQIKHYEGFTYLAGTANISGQLLATLTKLDTNNVVIWEYQLNMPSRIADFVKTDEGLLLVGRTEPGASANALIAQINDDGDEVFIKTYENTSRSLFLRIIEHHNPLNPDFPFYITAFENNTDSPSVFDDSQLYNIDKYGNINWITEYEFGQTDEQIGVAITPLNDGNLFIAGNGVDNQRGIIAKINGLNEAVLQPTEATISGLYNHAVELSNGNIVVSNFLTFGSGELVVSLFDNNLDLLNSLRLNDLLVGFISAAGADDDDNFYVIGTQNGQPILCKLSTVGNILTLAASKYFNNDENSFDGYALYVKGDKVYYADGRTAHPLSFGGSDILLGYFNTQLTDDCLLDAVINTSVENYNLSTISIAFSNVSTPSTIEIIDLLALSHDIEPICDETTDLEEVSVDKSLLTVFPNPTDTQITIGYRLSKTAHVNITLFDLQGRKIDEMVNTIQTAGSQYKIWNIDNMNLPTSTYFVQMLVDGEVADAKKLIIN